MQTQPQYTQWQMECYCRAMAKWNDGNIARRQAMLEEAGYPKNSYPQRAFAFIPKIVRDHIIDCEMRKQPAPPIYAKPPVRMPYID